MKFDFLNLYEELLNRLLENGYVFSDFAHLDLNTLEKQQKTVFLRHDIHHRDIKGGYKMAEIEQRVLGKSSATYFVQLGFVPVVALERERETKTQIQQDYTDFINEMVDQGIDVQPHVSPFSFHYKESTSFIREKDTEAFERLYDVNYLSEIVSNGDGTPMCRRLSSVGDDPLEIEQCIQATIAGLSHMSKAWREKFNIQVEGFSAHGESLINRFLTYSSDKILDDQRVWDAGLYRYTTDAIRVKHYLSYCSDNNYKGEELLKFVDSTVESEYRNYQILVHPAKWYL